MSISNTNEPQQTKAAPGLLSEIASASSQARSWWADRKSRHERLQQAKTSGLVPNWGWTPHAKPNALGRAVSEPAVSTVKDDAATPKRQRDLEWARVEGLFEGLSEAQEPERSPQSPESPEFRPTSAPATGQLDARRQAQRQELEQYSVLESI